VTASVNLNDQGRVRIQQILRDAINQGDTVYIAPFADSFEVRERIEITSQEVLDDVLTQMPLQPDPDRGNTDIQKAELSVYQFLAQQNHCRMIDNDAIREQAVVWLTDAPLQTKTAEEWIETPADSPFRNPNSAESQLRREWLEGLPQTYRSRGIPTAEDESYQLTIVDIPPKVQEFCTPAPGGEETCFVNRYLFQQLWFPSSVLMVFLIAGMTLLGKWYSWQKYWRLTIESDEEDPENHPVKFLKGNQRLAIGDFDASAVDYIECRDQEIRGYIERKRNQLYLIPTQQAPIYYNDQRKNSGLSLRN